MTSASAETTAPAFDHHVRTAFADAGRKEAFLPTPCVQNHAANLHALANGDLLCVWFGGTLLFHADASETAQTEQLAAHKSH